jgi:hypothetical protein
MQRIMIIAILSMLPLLNALAAEPSFLRRNPFVSPLDQGANGSSSADASRSSSAELKLKGILLSGEQPLVNFGGQIMAPGDEVAGYRLVAVGEGEAVFNRNGQIITMSLYAEPED